MWNAKRDAIDWLGASNVDHSAELLCRAMHRYASYSATDVKAILFGTFRARERAGFTDDELGPRIKCDAYAQDTFVAKLVHAELLHRVRKSGRVRFTLHENLWDDAGIRQEGRAQEEAS